MFGHLLGHPVDVCVPESVYPEIEELLAAYGANVRRVPRQAGIKSAIEVARRMAARRADSCWTNSSAKRTCGRTTRARQARS